MAVTKETFIKKIYKILDLKGYNMNHVIKIGEFDLFNFFLSVNGEEICVNAEEIKTDGKSISIWGNYAKQSDPDDEDEIMLCEKDLRCKDLKFILGEIQCFEQEKQENILI